MSDTDAPPTDRAPPPVEMTDEEYRDQMVEIALSFEGCSAAPATRQRYCDLLCTSPDDFADPRSRSEAAVQSGCARARLGFEFDAGLREDVLLRRYRTGYAVADVEMIARHRNAWRPPTWPIGRGDGVTILGPAGAHVLTAIGLVGDVLTSIDGGQRDPQHFEAILRRKRRYFLGTHGAALDGYPILGVVDWPTLAKFEIW